MFSALVRRLRSLTLVRVIGIVMRLRMFLLLITFLKASHSFSNRLLAICNNAYLFATMIMISVASPFVIGFFSAMLMALIRADRASLTRRKPGEALTFARARELWGTPRAFIRIVGGRVVRALLLPLYGLATGYKEGIRGTPFFVQMWLLPLFRFKSFPRPTRFCALMRIFFPTLYTNGSL